MYRLEFLTRRALTHNSNHGHFLWRLLIAYLQWKVSVRLEEWSMCFFQTTNSTRNRKGKFLFDELFGLDISSSLDDDDVVSRNCTCGKITLTSRWVNFFSFIFYLQKINLKIIITHKYLLTLKILFFDIFRA